MTTTIDQPTAEPAAVPTPDPRRFQALAVIAVAQLMVVLDASVVIIALPSAQRALHISTANRQWMLTAYTLAFAGLLLLGGRIADYFGRKRMFIVGLIGFAGGLGTRRPGPELGHALQRPRPAGCLRRRHGSGSAVAAHRRLHRAEGAGPGLRASTVASRAVARPSASSSAALLTAVRVVALDAAHQRALRRSSPRSAATAVREESRSPANHGYDLPGAATVTAGLVALVYGFTKAGTDGWAATTTLALFAAAGVLLVVVRG